METDDKQQSWNCGDWLGQEDEETERREDNNGKEIECGEILNIVKTVVTRQPLNFMENSKNFEIIDTKKHLEVLGLKNLSSD